MLSLPSKNDSLFIYSYAKIVSYSFMPIISVSWENNSALHNKIGNCR